MLNRLHVLDSFGFSPVRYVTCVNKLVVFPLGNLSDLFGRVSAREHRKKC